VKADTKLELAAFNRLRDLETEQNVVFNQLSRLHPESVPRLLAVVSIVQEYERICTQQLLALEAARHRLEARSRVQRAFFLGCGVSGVVLAVFQAVLRSA